MSEFPTLFSRGSLGSHEAENRLVLAPMVRNYGGTGTLITEGSYVRADGRGFSHELALDRDAAIEGLSRLAGAAHAHGALLGPQLYHAGRQTTEEAAGVQPVAPSALPGPLMKSVPRALPVVEIHEVVDCFGAAARRAREAGCDLVEIHGAHGYLITQFLSRYTNERDDDYGRAEVVTVGDAVEPRKVTEAVLEGARAALAI